MQRPSRTLRLRLTATYALFFTILLTFFALLFRQYLSQSLDRQVRDALEQDWGAVKGYLRIERGVPHWYVDYFDPDEAALYGRLHRVFYLADAKGNELDTSDTYRSFGAERAAFVQSVVSGRKTVFRELSDSKGAQYLVRSSFDNDEDKREDWGKRLYFVSIGRPLANNQEILRGFTWVCVGLIPLIGLGGCVLGWVYAGHALSPVMDIARAAERISGSNLSLRIPARKTQDEMDYLIETFNGMIERLEFSFNQIRQFSTDVSHELRTPITVVRGQLEVALFTAQTTEQYREAIVDSLHDIERLTQIVRALLSLSQAETGQVVLQRARLDVGAVVSEMAEQFQIPAESARVHLRYDAPAEPIEADLDRVQIERMISNLLSNALKFTPAGGEVIIALCPRENRFELEVRDTGVGIAPEHLPHIFDRFYRVSGTPERSPERGLGLGLSFVAWIIKAHGGTVLVESDIGRGTVFHVLLPRIAPARLDASITAQPANA